METIYVEVAATQGIWRKFVKKREMETKRMETEEEEEEEEEKREGV